MKGYVAFMGTILDSLVLVLHNFIHVSPQFGETYLVSLERFASPLAFNFCGF